MQHIKAFLGLGSNLGNCVETLHKALQQLNTHAQLEVTRTSSIYRTAPVGFTDQPDFYNLVAEADTSLSPEELLATILRVEKQLHRIRNVEERWGPRTIDIDILLYAEEIITMQPQLQIPHPRLSERAFVLIPLYEIAGDITIPGAEGSVKTYIDKLPTQQKIEKWPTLVEV